MTRIINGKLTEIKDPTATYDGMNKNTADTAIASINTAIAAKYTLPGGGTTAQYIRGDGTLATFPSVGSGTVTSITAGTGLTGGTITTSGTIALSNVGTAGTYSGVTTDGQGRVTSGTNRSVSGTTRTLNSSFLISSSAARYPSTAA